MKKINEYLKWITVSISFILFLVILFLVYKNGILTVDVKVFSYLRDNFMNDYVTVFLKIITSLGSSLCLITICVLCIIFLKRKHMKIAVPLNLTVVFLINQIIKNIMRRPRPDVFRLAQERGFSFPSAHAMVCLAFYGFLVYLINKNVENKYIKYSSVIILTVVILLIGISRIYLGVHYFSDVLAGLLLAICYLIIFIEVYKKVCGKYEK